MDNKIDLSLIIPAYNEEKIIKFTLKKTLNYFRDKKYTWEIIVVDDGSKDSTSLIARKLLTKNVALLKIDKNKGKGRALHKGVLRANGKYILYMDSDLSVPLKNIDFFYKKLKKVGGVVIASRRLKESKIEVHQPRLRENMGRVFTFITRAAMGVKVSDFTCGFKGFERKAAKLIFSKSKINRWAYDAEIIFLAKKLGFRITELPVHWSNRKDTKVKLKHVVFETLRDLLKIRIYNLLGKYD